MKVNREIFREYDIRGVVDRDLTDDIVYHLGRTIGTQAGRKEVRRMTVGRDCRLSSASFAAAIIRGLVESGIEVIDVGLCATPMLYFSIRHLRVDGGVMVTGSHNPPQFNGFKVCLGTDTIYGEEIQELRRIMENDEFTQATGSITQADIGTPYADFLSQNVTIKKPLMVCVDGGNGVGSFFACPIIRKKGCIVHE